MSRGTTAHTASPPTVLMTTATATTATGGMAAAPRPTYPRKSLNHNIIVDNDGDMFDTMTIEDSASELQRDIDLLQRLVDQVIISSNSSPLRQKQQQQQQQQRQIEYQQRHNTTSLPTFTNTSFHHPIGQHDLELSRKITTMTTTTTTSRWALSTFDSPLRNPTLTSPSKPKNFVDETSIIKNNKKDGESQHRSSSSLLDDDVDDYDGAMMLQQLLRQRQRKEWIRLSLSGDNAMTLSDYNPEDEAPKLPSRYVSSSVESIGVASAPPCSTNKKLLFSHSSASSSSSSLLSSSSLPPLAIH